MKRRKGIQAHHGLNDPLHAFMNRPTSAHKLDLGPALLALLLLACTVANLAAIVWTLLKWR